MSKKLITACMALFALAAFVLPASASAVELTHPTSTRLATNVKIDATSIGIQKLTDPSGNPLVECTSATMTGTLTKNNGSEVEGSIESTTFSGTGTNGECTSVIGGLTVDTNLGNGTPWCLRATPTMNADEFQVRGNSCANASRPITFVLTSTTIGTCKYSRSEPIRGTYTTDTNPNPQDAILSLSGSGETGTTDTNFTKEEGSFLCPGSGTLDMEFTLETDTTPTASPLYIS
ncbi:MAG: hypothetical protein ACTHNY_02640 [Solirubrobacterales bacterium]